MENIVFRQTKFFNMEKVRKYSQSDHPVSILKIMGTGIDFDHRVINDRKKLEWVVGVLKRENLKIVWTSGVYDQLHDGHIAYLAKAKELAGEHGVLIVGVDDDLRTRMRKPKEKNRPIDTLAVRLYVLSANRSVNILTTLSGTDKEVDSVIEIIHPDIAVFSKSTEKGPSFERKIRKNLSKSCDKIVFLKPQSTNSTTAKIRKIMANGANELANLLVEEIDKFFKANGN